jgi:hypothetical protein
MVIFDYQQMNGKHDERRVRQDFEEKFVAQEEQGDEQPQVPTSHRHTPSPQSFASR